MKEKHPIVKAIAQFIFFIGRMILSIRYKIVLSGVKHIKHNKPILFLPNHQAVVDPMLLISYLYPHKKIVPVITSTYYDLPIVKLFFKNWGAVRVSDLEKGSRNINVLNEITQSTLTAFKYKRSIVIYPSGQIAGQGYEKILNKKGAFEIVKNLPSDVQIIGVRINGLWGSMWSKAWTGQSPDFAKNILKGIYYTIVNLLFFMPRRKVSIQFEDITTECIQKSKLDKKAFNELLEQFYNINGEENPQYLKHYFYGPKLTRKLPKNAKGSATHFTKITPSSFSLAITQGVNTIITNHLQLNLNHIKPNAHLINELGIDSINLVGIINDIEKQFKIQTTHEITNIKTVTDLYLLANENINPGKPLPPCSFTKNNPFNNFIKINNVNNIPEQFIKKFTSNNHLAFSYDTMLGETNRKDFFMKTCVVAEIIKNKCPNKHIGIMLPALQSTTLLIMATYLAGKIPVMLNWTVGHKILEHCAKQASIEVIITASSFVEKIQEQLPKSILNKLILLDQEIQQTGIISKIKGFVRSKFPTHFYHFKNLNDTAVILFTSGSENMPKMVPLSHQNIIQDLKGTLELIDIERNRILLAFLPPFHSYGFTVLSILPVLTGVRTVFSPDPTDGKALVKLIKHTQSSLIITAPAFLKIILNNAIKEDLKSLKYTISGAESLSTELLNNFKQMAPQATLIEGYGITECSPILSLNPLQHQKNRSVGKVIKGVLCRITDLETGKTLKNHKEGMINFSGKNIFSGYTDHSIPSPFVRIENKQFYKTGDLGYMDKDGYLFITGRLKRFIKVAGEMISLPFIENILIEHYGEDEDKTMAIEGSDKTSPPQIVLFSTKPITLNEANTLLKDKNAPLLAKISHIQLIEEIPLLGVGKIDYKTLKQKIETR